MNRSKLFLLFAIVAVFTFGAGFAYAVPNLSSITPNSKNVGDATFTLTVNGSGNRFANGVSTVRFNGSNRTTTWVNNNKLTASIPAADLLVAGSNSITVYNSSGSHAGTSNALTLTVNNPSPTLGSISPTATDTGSVQFELTINGTNFVSTSTVRFNGSSRTTTFVSSTQLTATITADDVDSGGTYPITVNNPTPGGGTSSSINFSVTNPVPTVTSISPTYKNAGGGSDSTDLTVNGTNFVSDSIVRFDGDELSTEFISETELVATIPAGYFNPGQEGTKTVTVTSPAPGGGVSNGEPFYVLEMFQPGIANLSPASVTYGDDDITLEINGTTFFNGSVTTLFWENLAIPFTYISSSQLTTPVSSLVDPGVYEISVYNDIVFGGYSNLVPFTIYTAPPTVSGLDVNADICPIAPATGQAIFSWEYSDLNGDAEEHFELQVDDNSNFSSPEIDRNVVGSTNQQAVNILLNTNQADSLTYGSTYYWRVKVCQVPPEEELIGPRGICSAWTNGTTYSTDPHPGPYVSFSVASTAPAVTISNDTHCYNTIGETACDGFVYDFGDGTTFTDNTDNAGVETTSHTYAELSTYDVETEATDFSGLVCSEVESVNISQGKAAFEVLWRETNPFTFLKPPPVGGNGSIQITKFTNGGPGTNVSFGFNINFGGFNYMILGVDTVAGDQASNSTTFDDIPAGTYFISEYPDPDWTLFSSSCNQGVPGSFTVSSGQTTKCTFINDYTPSGGDCFTPGSSCIQGSECCSGSCTANVCDGGAG